METKEINVSEINFPEVKAESNASVATLAEVAAPGEALTLAQTIVQAMEQAKQAQKEKILTDAEQNQKKIEEYLKANPVVTEIFEQKGKHVVYIPHDLRNDIYYYDERIVDWSNLRIGNELDYVLVPSQFSMMKSRVALKAIDLYRKIENLEEYVRDSSPDELLFPRISSQIPKLIEDLKALYKPLEEAASTATPDSMYTFDEMAVILGNPGTLIGVEVFGDQKLAVTTKSAEIESGFFGTYIQAKGEFYVCGPELRKAEHYFYIGAYSGKKSLRELGITPVNSDEEFKNYLKERGAKALEVTSKPFYGAYKGDLYRRTYRTVTAFRSTGRVMIDFERMTEMDPNYSMYLGGTADRQASKFKANAVTVTDEVLITMSPFVYGFSFLSKVWGELAVEKLSEITFREDAYDKLVMDEDQKEMILSLVETQLEGQRTDIIDGKGGGCIFLLAGEPGTGDTLTLS